MKTDSWRSEDEMPNFTQRGRRRREKEEEEGLEPENGARETWTLRTIGSREKLIAGKARMKCLISRKGGGGGAIQRKVGGAIG